MEFRQLKYFYTVANMRSLSEAAEHLNVSQPAIGMQIRKLEDLVGSKLFIRHARGIRLTPAGEIMLDHTSDILNKIDILYTTFKDIRKGSKLDFRIGVTPSLGRVFVPRLMELCYDQHPRISLLFSQNFHEQLLTDVLDGNLDFSFTKKQVNSQNFETVPLYKEPVRLIGSAEEIKKLSKPITLDQIAHLPLVLDGRDEDLEMLITCELTKINTKLSDVIKVQSIQLRKNYIANHSRFALAPSALFHSEIISGSFDSILIPIPALRRNIHLVGPVIENMTAAENQIRELIIKIIMEMVDERNYEWELIS